MPIFIPDYLSRPAPTDDIATHTDTEGKGGYRIVSDLVERDAIVNSHRKFGMLVFCESDQQIYKLGIGLTNLDWEIFTASGGGLTPTAIQTSAYTANSNELVLCDTSGGGFTVTLPATPSNGEKVGILDVSNSFSETNKLTIDPGINEIIGSVDILDVTIGRSAITFICVDNGGVFGWHILDSIPNLSGNETSPPVSYNYNAGTIDSTYRVVASSTGTNSSINVIFDDGFQFTPSTGIFIPQSTGYYAVTFSCDINITGLTYVSVQLRDSVDTIMAQSFVSTNGTTNALGSATLYAKFTQGEEYRVMIFGTASGTIHTTVANRITISKIQDSLVSNIRGTANLDLSLTEINTGKKSFDGKDRYTKVINLGTIASGGVNFPHGIVGIDRVIDQYVIAKNTVSPYNQFKITGYQTTATDYVYVSDTEIRVNIITGTLYNCYAILEYTKV